MNKKEMDAAYLKIMEHDQKLYPNLSPIMLNNIERLYLSGLIDENKKVEFCTRAGNKEEETAVFVEITTIMKDAVVKARLEASKKKWWQFWK